MASTYTHQEAVDHCNALVKGIPISNIRAISVDMVHSLFWKAYPWKWTRQTMTAIPLVDGTQDYSLNILDSPYFWKPLNHRITRTDVTPDTYIDLKVFRHLEPLLSQKIGYPQFGLISYESEVSKLRLEAACSVPSGVILQIDGEFQKIAPKITNLAATIVFPDQHFGVYVEGILWMLYRLANDKRAGSIVKAGDQVQMTGQMGVFYAAMNSIVDQEESGFGDTIYPADGSIGSGGVGPFYQL